MAVVSYRKATGGNLIILSHCTAPKRESTEAGSNPAARRELRSSSRERIQLRYSIKSPPMVGSQIRHPVPLRSVEYSVVLTQGILKDIDMRCAVFQESKTKTGTPPYFKDCTRLDQESTFYVMSSPGSLISRGVDWLVT